ncbi:MAG: trehalose-phosphatase, partial [Acidobacteriaceae bacterium]|nr:trehalose-phosphatase [Acidobacteriaceae bacterium]
MTMVEQIHHPAPVFSSLDEIERRVTSGAQIALFLDFDGTLSKIVPHPTDAELDPHIRSMLKVLTARPDFTVAVVSGRALKDVRQRVGLTDVIYVGNHGLEIESDSICFREPEAETLRRELRSLSLQLKLALCDTDG